MGFNTTVFIINDGFGEIERNPEQFVRGINEKMMSGGTVMVGNHANCVEVMRTAHADTFRLYGSHGNLMIDLSAYSPETQALWRRDERMKELVLSYVERARRELDTLEEAITGKKKPVGSSYPPHLQPPPGRGVRLD